MNYLWNEFDIPTFPSKTLVFLDGVFRADLSTSESLEIKADALPTHIIIKGGNRLPHEIVLDAGAVVYMTALINGGDNKVNIVAKGAGARFLAGIYIENDLFAKIDITANHLANDTEISADTRIFANKNSDTSAGVCANIGSNLIGVKNSLNFQVLADKNIKNLKITPNQFINSEKINASHGASMDTGSPEAIRFLEESGLNSDEVNTALIEAFRNSTFNHLPK
jgi:hypothetical protein